MNTILVSSRLIRACDVPVKLTAVTPKWRPQSGYGRKMLAGPNPKQYFSTATTATPPEGQERSNGRPNNSYQSRSTFWLLLSLLPGTAFLYSTCFSIATINGGSMTPTLNPDFKSLGVSATKDVVLLNRWKSITLQWQIGDIVAFTSPENPNHLYTKRLIGLPGDVIRVQTKKKVIHSSSSSAEVNEWSRIKIPQGHCWVESDSTSDLSRDSRHFGPIPMGLLTAKIDCIIWPLNRIGRPKSRPDLNSKTPGRPGLEYGWWPFGSKDDHKSKQRQMDDSHLTPYTIEGGKSDKNTSRNTQFVDSIGVSSSDPNGTITWVGDTSKEDTISPTTIRDEPGEMPQRKSLKKNRPIQELDSGEREKVVNFLNSLSRGGSLGHHTDAEED